MCGNAYVTGCDSDLSIRSDLMLIIDLYVFAIGLDFILNIAIGLH